MYMALRHTAGAHKRMSTGHITSILGTIAMSMTKAV